VAASGGVAVPQRNVVVFQPLPGIGDMVWHLPHIRAMAAHVGGPVTLVAKPRSAADQVFAGEATVRDVLWLDRNPERRRGRHDGPVGLARLVAELRLRRFDSAVILHHSRMLAFAAMAAGISERQGYGYGTQRVFLNRGPFLPASTIRLHQFQRASAWLVAAGIPIAEAEPLLAVSEAARSAVRARLGMAGPFVALGIGGSEDWKQWGAPRFTALAAALLDAGWPLVVLVGGAGEAPIAEAIVAGLGARGRVAVPALGWHLTETVALLADAAFLIGNNTATMNMAAAVGVRSYGLFGTAPPFRHSAQIVPIVSGGPDDGVTRLGLDAVLAAVVGDRGGLGRGV